jgi:hypothetical protein
MSGPISPPLTVTTVGGTPEGRPITTIRVSNGDLTISGNVATIDTSGSGGGGTVTSIATSAPITGGTITTTGTIGISQADSTTDGYLSSTDWNTFNDKQDSITLTTTGTSGAATLIGATLNIPNYTNTATIGGSIAANQVAYGSAANEIQGSANLTFDGSNLDVSGYISAGGVKVSPSGAGTITTTSTTDLVLSTNGGTDSGTITITDGADGQISITPNGTGEVVAGNYRLDVDETVGVSQDGYALTYTNSTGLISLKEVSGGGGSPAGSDREIQFNDNGSFGAVSAFKIGSSNTIGIGTNPSSAYSLKTLSNIQSLGAVWGSSHVGTNGGSATQPTYKYNTNNTGLFFSAVDQIDFTLGGTNHLSFGSAGEILVGGSASGTSGQVLTSGGSGAAVSWADASGGGSGFVAPQMGTGTFLSTYDAYYMNAAPYGVGAVENEAYTDYQEYGIYRPMVMPEGGTWGGVEIQVSSASTSNALLVSLYESDSTTGMPTSFVGYCEVATTSTGAVAQTTTLNSSGSSATISLTAAKQYWVAVVAKSNSDSFSLSCAKTEALSPLSATNMGSQFTVARNIFVDNNIETNNPPRINQLLERNFPLVGVIIS